MNKDYTRSATPTVTHSAHRGRHKIASQLLMRGQRLRQRAGLLIGLSLGLVALLSILD